ncbi:M67 family metallopeptidase [Roseofilum casamattae]|uniref:M67 family metallopeptidase n=1 Tax=Roseofilum casamattae BLCC-M143 TaxID=3022442 RepID=A0ABT7BSU5_9CYAN|nr:M67 family metallopeptidase [Roseofilum casamattae]MDJ1182262.1 M67 family metallopeptidase [Roseofilum casamattae BLCC-M143]
MTRAIASSNHQQDLCAHAERCYPQECCGVLLGRQEQGAVQVVQVVPTENAWTEEMEREWEESGCFDRLGTSKRERYAIAPETLLHLQRSARDRNLNIIGFYHSHPDSPAIPSECDRQLAWSDCYYAIVSVRNGKAVEVNTWVLDSDRQFQRAYLLNISSHTHDSSEVETEVQWKTPKGN